MTVSSETWVPLYQTVQNDTSDDHILIFIAITIYMIVCINRTHFNYLFLVLIHRNWQRLQVHGHMRGSQGHRLQKFTRRKGLRITIQKYVVT